MTPSPPPPPFKMMMTTTTRSLLWLFLMVIVLMIFPNPTLAAKKKDEWYQTCSGGECGYSSKSSSGKCRDDNENCPTFALEGECLANPTWMLQNCQKSCGVCKLEDIGDDADCQDLHANCPTWAGELECFTNPAYMSRACPKSCWLCANTTDLGLNHKNIKPQDILQIKTFANTNFGLWQSIPDDDPGDLVRKEIMKMGQYAKSLKHPYTGPGSMCNNRYHDCVQWTFTKGCVEELEFMLSYCSLACQQCDIVEDFKRCKIQPRPHGSELYGDSKMILTHLFHSLEGENLLDEYSQENGDNGEWVLSLDHKVLWDDPEAGKTDVLSSIKTLEWTEQTSAPNDPPRSGRSAICDAACRADHPSIQALHSTIATTLLQIDPKYLMPLEFVHYQRGERYASHHDYRLHDQWKHGGRRAISVFIGLQSAKKGGAFGFPDLDWLLIEEPAEKVLVWPNISPRNQKVSLEKMNSEQLPVVEGDMYGVYVWVREYPYVDGNPCA